MVAQRYSRIVGQAIDVRGLSNAAAPIKVPIYTFIQESHFYE